MTTSLPASPTRRVLLALLVAGALLPHPSSASASAPGTPPTLAKPVPSNVVRPAPGPYKSMFDGNTVVAFYGHPNSTRMGILGENSLEATLPLLRQQAAAYDAANGPDGVIMAFHLIYATIHPDGTTTRLKDDTVLKYVQFAMEHGIVVILDHQLGNAPVMDGVESMLPWLHWPNVHLAIDPEWRTPIPNKEIGSISAEELNAAMDRVQAYLVANGIEQRKMFMVHQFFWRMITQRETVKPAPNRIDLIHNADGFGHPQLKLDTYRTIVAATNMPLKGFKLFYPKPWKTAGFDAPLMSPETVMNLNPRPVFINYQ